MGYKAMEQQAERFTIRLSEVVNELGAYSKVMRDHQSKINAMELSIDSIPAEFMTVILSGYYCYHLSHEAHALVMILKEFLPALEQASQREDLSANAGNILSMKKAVNDIEPLISQTMKDMSPFKVMDFEKILEELKNRDID